LLRPAGAEGVGSALEPVPAQIVGKICNWWWARGFSGRVGTARLVSPPAAAFPGRRILRIARLIPHWPFPPTLLAASLIGRGSPPRPARLSWRRLGPELADRYHVQLTCGLLSTESFSTVAGLCSKPSRQSGWGHGAVSGGLPCRLPCPRRSRCGPERDGGGQ